jgi:hypothetical protein
MTREDVVREFGAERLARHNFFARDETREDEIGIMDVANGLVVYRTDERNQREYEFTTTSEAEALGVFATKLRTHLALRDFVRSRGLQ